MSAYGPSPYFEEQVATIVAQMDDGDILVVVDDGSRQVKWESLREKPRNFIFWTRLERLGASASFLQLVIDAGVDAEYYYLSDQDDLWVPGKLSIQAQTDEIGSSKINATVHAWLILRAVDAQSKNRSAVYPLKKLSMAHYCFETPAPGMTMSFNHECRQMFVKKAELIKKFSDQLPHDRILMALVGMYGVIQIISKPLVLYRQHGGNVVGASQQGLLDTWMRRMRSPFRAWRTVSQGRALFLALITNQESNSDNTVNCLSLGEMRLRTNFVENWITWQLVILLGAIDRIFRK